MNKKTQYTIYHIQYTKRGFTLVELLIVISIIGILASLGIGSFTTAQARGRDAQRKSDLKQVSHALELYFSDHGSYPTPPLPWGAEFSDSKGTVYFKKLPMDPSVNSYSYNLVGGSNQKYQLFATLENSRDKDCINDDCSTSPNFAVTSANTNATE